MKYLNIIYIFLLLFVLSSCQTGNDRKRRRPKSQTKYVDPKVQQEISDISYYKERSPGAHRVEQLGALRKSNAGRAVDGKLLREKDEQEAQGSLWSSESQYNYLFVPDKNKNIGDIIYIDLKEDLRSMLKRSRSRYYSPYRYRSRRTAVRQRGKQATVKKKTTPQKPNLNSQNKKKKKRKKLKKNTYIAARIIDKLSNGTFLIEGHKLVDVNNKIRQILISGYVQESDINKHDEVDSRKMADLSIDYVVVRKK